ncbi:MAG: glycosyltransferase family 4 protein [Actinobacteria bacterium]|nr:glycosyltransferase family 4 protein [Actinomycetota bacterium]
MRIAYLSTDYPAVSHTFIQREIHALEARGIEVVPITLNRAPEGQLLTDLDRSDAARTFVVKSASAGVAAALATTMLRHPLATLRGIRRAFGGTHGDLTRIRKQFLQFLEALLVWRHCRAERCDGLHAHFGQVPATVAWFTAAFANDVRRSGRFTWSVTIHGWHEFVTEDTSRLADKLDAADGVVCISSFTRSQLMRIGPVSAWPKIDIVRCGLDLDDFPFRGERPAATAPTVVITARLSPEKGHLVLIQAVGRLRAAGTDVRVRCIGSGPFEADLRGAAAAAGVTDLIEFVGALAPSAVAAALRDADVFCLPSFAEGLPVSIMEAMAVGVPVVTTYISGIPELVVNDHTGWVVPAGDAEALAAALASALSSPDRDLIVRQAREAVAAAHDIRRNVVGLEAALRRAHAGA